MTEMTKLEWAELKEALSLIPAKKRTAAVKKTAEFVDGVLAGKDNLAIDVDLAHPEKARYAVSCSLCKRQIRLDEDYCFRVVEGVNNHLDCWFQDSAPETPSSGT